MTGPDRDRRTPPKRNNFRRPQGGKSQRPMPPGRTMGFWVVIVLLLFLGFNMLNLDSVKQYNISYSTFLQEVDQGNIAEVTQNEREITGKLAARELLVTDDGTQQNVEDFVVILPVEDPSLIARIAENNPDAIIKGQIRGMNWWSAMLTYLPFLLILACGCSSCARCRAAATRPSASARARPRCSTWTSPRSPSRTWPAATRPSTNCRRSSTSSGAPEVPAPGRPHPQGRPAGGPARHGQDPAGPGRGRRGRRALLQHERLGLRGDVRGRGRQPRARPLRPGQEAPRPASSSSTRSTPWAATAAPAWAAATTSASRPSTSCWWRWTASSPTRA